MKFSDFLKNNIVYLDGGMGTLLQKLGLEPGEYPELWNITHPDIITNIHKSYFDSGSNVISANTFGANILKFTEEELENIVAHAIENAKNARIQSQAPQEKFIALDIGPSGKLLRPYGDLDFEDAVTLFSKTVKLGVKYGAELIIIETMNDSYETKAALLAAKENSNLPVIVTNAYGEDGKLMTGATPEVMAFMLEGMGADAIGANCSLGPKQLRTVADKLLEYASVPVVLKPNAGLPKIANGETVFDVCAEEFANEVSNLAEMGVRVIGGCCGTTPEYIEALVKKTKQIKPQPIEEKNITAVTSYTHAVIFENSPILIGERINPTGKKRLKEALINKDVDYILNEAVQQQEKGVHILDVNVGLPEIDEKEMLASTVCEIQAVVDIPLQIDTANYTAMESALRYYNGKPLINSVNGKTESMKTVFPLAKKYGGAVIALTLDENGIPNSPEERIRIAKKILKTAKKYGISKKDIIFDTLAMTVSASSDAAISTLFAMKEIKYKLGCHTSLGVSNISYGLPNRDAVNGTFLALALENGLSAAIMNPYSSDMMKTYFAYRVLKGLDKNCAEFINSQHLFAQTSAVSQPPDIRICNDYKSELSRAIGKGLKERAGEITKELLKISSPLDIVESDIIPALNTVGVGYENKTVFLPQLLMSAEAAKSSFEVIKSHMSSDAKTSGKGPFVIATVEGDIHDIGKNIVKLILENYGFNVIDLGRDVAPEAVVNAAVESNAVFVGLSALMTTTLPAMAKTVKMLKDTKPSVKIIVGGAVLTADYAERIGADKYAKDAMEAVRYAEKIQKHN